jgi:hypothetical protein
VIDLTQYATASPLIHAVPCDPGTSWLGDSVAIDAPPDNDIDPSPAAQWPTDSVRTGLCGAVSPRVIALPGGGYRMYYTQILPREGFAQGANDYDNATTRILSATSSDGVAWTPERGVRLSAQAGGAGKFRVASSEVVPLDDGSERLRMYYECCAGPQSQQNSIRSAVSADGLDWTVETGVRLELSDRNITSPRIIFLDDGRCRLYCGERGRGIISAMSEDGGLTFEVEPDLRVAADQSFDRFATFAPEIILLPSGGYRMFYAGYGDPKRAHILTAVSDDGLNWLKDSEPVLAPGSATWDAVKCSEMCVIQTPLSRAAGNSFRMFYEACDGTAQDQRGVWRIGSATCVG